MNLTVDSLDPGLVQDELLPGGQLPAGRLPGCWSIGCWPVETRS
ncbi:hypothetical protein [Streptomyces sp. CB02923]|nr:hypothetical protein [Streptomyces sp. CB02923]